MGLTSWAGARPRKADASIAKNYLNADELDALNRIVSLYLDFAELQAKNRRAMTPQGSGRAQPEAKGIACGPTHSRPALLRWLRLRRG